MINKYTLRFEDFNLEEPYQEYQTKNNRKPLLLRIFFIALMINIMDFTQSIITNSFSWVTPELIVTSYLPYLFLGCIFMIIACCKPKYCRWALLIQSHIFAYSYFQQQFSSIEQYKFYTFLIIGTQFLIFLTGEFIEVLYQTLVFTGIYLYKLISEDEVYHYSLVPAGILTAIMFIFGFYTNQIKLRSQFKLRFLDNQWEQIFISIITESYLIFDYDDEDYNFKFRNQQQFIGDITNTEKLRKFLRKTTLQIQVKENLEQFLYQEMRKNVDTQNIIKQSLLLLLDNGKQQSIIYSIFYGVRPILILQCENRHSTVHFNKQEQMEPTFQSKYKLLLKAAYASIHQHRPLCPNYYYNLIKLKRYCLYSSLTNYLITEVNEHQNLSICSFSIYKLLTKLKQLYPEKQITIQSISNSQIFSNWQLLATIIVGIIEKALTYRLEIRVKHMDSKKMGLMFFGYFNEQSCQTILNKINLHPNIIYGMIIEENCIRFSQYLVIFLILKDTALLVNSGTQQQFDKLNP